MDFSGSLFSLNEFLHTVSSVASEEAAASAPNGISNEH